MKKFAATVILIALTILAFAGIYRVLSWKDTMGDYLSSVQQLYATDRNTIDVLFVGSSHVYGDINPDVIWREQGFSSFDMAISGQDAPAAYHYTMEALKTQSPQVVMVDLLAASFEEGTTGNTYRSMLPMRTGVNQVRMVMEDPNTEKNRGDYILKWPVIHSRYRELGAYDFITNDYSDYGRGYCYRFTVADIPHDPAWDALMEADELSERNRKWIDDLVTLSEEREFELAFTLLPYEIHEWDRRIYNGIFAYLDELEVPYLTDRTLFECSCLDYETDYLDFDHLNASGGEKLSRWLGGYLASHYALEDHRGDAAYHQWDESLAWADRLCLGQEIMEMNVPTPYFERISGEEGLVTLVRLDGDYASSSLNLERAGESLGLKGGFFERQGVAVIRDGKLLAYLNSDPGEDYFLDLDETQILKVHSSSDAKHPCDVFLNGELVFEPFDGLGVFIWDPLTGTVLDKKIFY